ncbi:hypothetical protein ACWD7F_34590 [Streptomyces sp. NPDC005122]
MLDPLVEQVEQCRAAPEGTGFTEKLNRAAYTAGCLASAGHLDREAARDRLLQAANTARPWQTLRNERIIDDALTTGAARPFRLQGPS